MKKVLLSLLVLTTAGFHSFAAAIVEIPVQKIVFEPGGDDILASGMIESIEIIPLEKSAVDYTIYPLRHLRYGRGGFLCYMDGCTEEGCGATPLFHYNREGKLICTIGEPSVTSINDFGFDSEGNIFVLHEYIYITTYDQQGKVIDSVQLPVITDRAVSGTDGTVWTYLGYGNGRADHRLLRLGNDLDVAGEYLSADEFLQHMTELNPVFTAYKDKLYLRESMNRFIHEIDGKVVSKKYEVDFGSTAIPEEIYTIKDRDLFFDRLIQMLGEDEFSVIHNFMVNDNYRVMQTRTQRDGTEVENYIGIQAGNDPEWNWYSCGEEGLGNMIFMESLCITPENELICFVESKAFAGYPDHPLVTNPEVLSNTDADHFIIVCTLK